METSIYKVLREAEYDTARADGSFPGSPDDARDGYVHLSSKAQLRGTLARHFAHERGLVVLEVEAAKLGSELKWETSRGGALFPHLYGALPMSAVVRTLALDRAGDLPPEFP